MNPQQLFIIIFNMGIIASLVIVVVLVARLAFKRIPANIRIWLWAVVLFRIVCPFAPQSKISVMPDVVRFVNTPKTNLANYAISNIPVATDTTVQGVQTAVLQNTITPVRIIAAIWLVGVLALVLFNIACYLKIKIQLSTATKIQDNIFQTDKYSMPFVLGRKIYLPIGISANHSSAVIAHEKAHIKNFDYILKPIAVFAVILHWFNPLVWICYSLFVKDIETRCDETVLNTGENKENYADALLSLATNQHIFCPNAFGQSDIANRIKNALQYKKPKIIAIVIGVVLVLGVTIILLFNAKPPVAGDGSQDNNITVNTPVNVDIDNPTKTDDGLTTDTPKSIETVTPVTLSEGVYITRGYVGEYPQHNAIDFAAPNGTPINSIQKGTVVEKAEGTTGNGNYIVIDHGDYKSAYAHCQTLDVELGDTVERGQQIATVGSTGDSTGNHLHLEIRVGEQTVDPALYIQASNKE